MMIWRQDLLFKTGFYVAMKKQTIHRSVEGKRRNQNDMTGDEDKKYS
jgi:hypothetical protein